MELNNSKMTFMLAQNHNYRNFNDIKPNSSLIGDGKKHAK